MKILLLLCFILPTVTWLTDFNKAKIIAKEDNKLILLNFSGSDWCGPCIKLKEITLEAKPLWIWQVKNWY